jgi:hypothetical protein
MPGSQHGNLKAETKLAWLLAVGDKMSERDVRRYVSLVVSKLFYCVFSKSVVFVAFNVSMSTVLRFAFHSNAHPFRQQTPHHTRQTCINGHPGVCLSWALLVG